MHTKELRSSYALILFVFGCVLCWGCSLHASNQDDAPEGDLHKTQVVASRDPLVAQCNFKMWIPENTPIVRSIIVINRRAAGKHLFFKDSDWRGLASRSKAAMLYCEFESIGVRNNGYGLSILTACLQFAIELNRPELKHAPFILWGHSMGGRVTQDFVRFKPSRVLAFHIALRANKSSKEFMQEEDDAMRVPGLYLMGDQDQKPRDIREHFGRARRGGAPRAWIWLPGQAHWPKGMDFNRDNTTDADWKVWSANDVVIPWTEAIIRLRLPQNSDPGQGPVHLSPIDISKGWLGDIKTGQFFPSATFVGIKSDASWFPTKNVAKAWARYSFRGSVDAKSKVDN